MVMLPILSCSVRVSFVWTSVTDKNFVRLSAYGFRGCIRAVVMKRLQSIRSMKQRLRSSLCKIDRLRNETNAGARRPNAPRWVAKRAILTGG
jgi:hypothetical protein